MTNTTIPVMRLEKTLAAICFAKRLRVAVLCALALMSLSTRTWADGSLKAGDTIAVCGDSITEQQQYSVFIEEYLLMCQPVADLHINQFGWSGETSWGFLPRMTNNVLPFRPTVATTCYGMNDGGYAPLSDEKAVNYRKSLTAIVETFKKAGVRVIVLGSPGCVDSFSYFDGPAKAVMYNKTLGQLRDIAREVAAAEGVAFADVHQTMIDAMAKAKAKNGEKYLLAGGDGVHPASNGHLVMAYAFLKALGCDGNIGTITVDLAGGKAEATAGHEVLGMANGSVELESSRYPFCLSGTQDPNGTLGVAEFFPFYADLNRLMLVVNHPGAARLKVTFGPNSKEFSAEDTAKGINLAAEFPDNPFVEPFKRVDAAVRAQQNFETPLVKTWLDGGVRLASQYPDTKSAVDSLSRILMAKDLELMATASKAVVPVKYTLKVEAVQ